MSETYKPVEILDNFSVLNQNYYIKMQDGAVYAIPVAEIATHRADTLKHHYDNDFMQSLYADTLPLFQEDTQEVGEWARGNMIWSDVCAVAVQVTPPSSHKLYPEDWINPVKTEVQ